MSSSAKRYRALADAPSFATGRDRTMVYQPLTQSVHHIHSEARSLLSLCPRWATLDEHAARIAADAPEHITAELMRGALDQLVRSGLFVTEQQLLERAARVPATTIAPSRGTSTPTEIMFVASTTSSGHSSRFSGRG